jgi:hypothetical protein
MRCESCVIITMCQQTTSGCSTEVNVTMPDGERHRCSHPRVNFRGMMRSSRRGFRFSETRYGRPDVRAHHKTGQSGCGSTTDQARVHQPRGLALAL